LSTVPERRFVGDRDDLRRAVLKSIREGGSATSRELRERLGFHIYISATVSKLYHEGKLTREGTRGNFRYDVPERSI
jgi:hypothetical protein